MPGRRYFGGFCPRPTPAGVPVETVIYEGEGHGYYLEKNQVDFYTRLLAFFDKHIGSGSKAAD